MVTWLLKIELEGEWEECLYCTQAEALTAFVAVAADYGSSLSSAVLVCADAYPALSLQREQRPVYIN